MIFKKISNSTLYNVDCLNYIKTLEDQCVDLVISSPPYNIGMSYNTYNDNQDNYIAWQTKIWNECCRILKPSGHLFINLGVSKTNPFDAYKIAENINWVLQNNIVWAKSLEIDGFARGYSTPTSSKRYLRNGFEHIFHFTKDGNTEIDLEWSGIPYNTEYNNAERNFKRSGKRWRPTTNCWHLTYESKATKKITKELTGDKKHPAIYPIKLVEKCIKVSGLKNGVVFDPFLGTGTTSIVAESMGLNSIGCEIDKDYFDFACERLERIN